MSIDAHPQALRIAITGIGGIFPKAADLDSFWRLIAEGHRSSRRIPDDRWPVKPDRIHDHGEAVRDRTRSIHACLLDPLNFDPDAFNLDPELVSELDPLFHLTLMAGHAAYNDQTGQLPNPEKTSVILGNIALPTESLSAWTNQLAVNAVKEIVTGDHSDFQLNAPDNSMNLNPAGLPAALLSMSLNLGGGYQTLDAACASSLYSIKLAVNELVSGRMDAVITGGVGRPDSMYTQMGFSQLRAVSPSGICSPFDQDADGLVIGEGAGIVVLRRLDDALAAGNHIYGVIRGIGLSNDIQGSLFAPDSGGQIRAIRQAYDHAGWNPGDVDLIECHATGTPVGDAVEFTSMNSVWQEAGVIFPGRCVIGSVKSNVGHLLTGAGGAGLLKVLLAMKHQTLPPTANYSSPSVNIEGSPFRILQQSEDWTKRTDQTPRRAAVSAFGFGGINAHVLVEEFQDILYNQTREPVEIRSTLEPVAVVGMSASAGPWTDFQSLQQRLMGIQTTDTEPEKQDLPCNELLQKSSWFRQQTSEVSSGTGYPISSTYIPLGRFRIPPSELREMLPQQLLMLKTAGDAIGQSPWRTDLAEQSGVFIGIGLDLNTTNFQIRWCLEQTADQWKETVSENPEWKQTLLDAWSPPLTANRTMGALGGIVASRIARAFKIGGAGFTVSSEETTGLKTLETAVNMLRNGDIKQAIVGSVDLATDWRSLTGHPEKYQGYQITDGAVALVLKPLSAAEADGDTVLAIIDDIPRNENVEKPGSVVEFPSDTIINNIGYTGIANGLFAVASSVAALHQRVLPGNMKSGPQYWLHNREDGPRRSVIKMKGRDNNSISVGLSEHTLSADKPLKLPLLTPGFGSTLRDIPSTATSISRESTAFVYSGSGSHRPFQGRELGFAFRHILDKIDKESLRLEDQFQPQLYWNQPDKAEMDKDPHGLIIGHVTYCFFVTELLRCSEVIPGNIIGYSLGESSGLIAQRIWPDRDAVLQKLEQSTLFTEALGGPCTVLLSEWELPPGVFPNWQMVIVNISADELIGLMEGWQRLYLLIRNTPEQCVLGGHGPDLKRFLHENKLSNSISVTGVTIAHLPAVYEVEDEYLALHYWPVDNPGNITVYSGAWKKSYPVKSESCSKAILAHATEGIDFPATIETAYGEGVKHFVEIGPGSGCSGMISQILDGHSHTDQYMGSSLRQPDAFFAFLEDLAGAGWSVNTETILKTQPSQWIELPQEAGGIPCHPVNNRPDFPSLGDLLITTVDQSRESEKISQQKMNPVSVRLAQQLDRTASAVNQAQAQYIELTRNWTENMRGLIEMQTGMIPLASPDSSDKITVSPQGSVFMDRTQCLEFARGSAGSILGQAFSEVDTFPTRVRLPDEPLMLVDRILSIKAEPKSMTHGNIVTEHDVLPDTWYLDQGKCPVCIAVEAGQADLFLSGYLGIDFETQGVQKYRLLDAEITMHRGLPKVNETIRYDIRITRFFKQSGIWLFSFEYDATINGQPMLTMRNGSAGFFSDSDLDEGQGIVQPRVQAKQSAERLSSSKAHIFTDISPETYSATQLNALRDADLAGCFGSEFKSLPLDNPPVLPGGKMHLIDRIVEMNPTGGRYGLGKVKAEADIDPNAWFLTCHFVDDMVMPGTLMYECCFHAFRVLLMRFGWLGDASTFAWDPRPGVVSRLKCRGQVIQSTEMAAYEITVKEIGFDPAPYAIADALMFADGRPVVEIQNMSVQLNGLTRESIEKLWSDNRNNASSQLETIYNKETVMAFSNGNPSEAFGEKYRVFDLDNDRIIARLPGPPYQFLDRIVQVTTEKWRMEPGGTVIAEYDVPDTDWYFDANGYSGMPFSILLEIALQPCGWYSAYMGSALHSEKNLSYRNLGGKGTIKRLPRAGAGSIAIAVDSTGVSKSGGMIIQNFNFRVYDTEGDIYIGDTYFGFFTKEALSDQIGIREDNLYDGFNPSTAIPFPDNPVLPIFPLRMMDEITVLEPDGGPDKLGFIEGRKKIDPDEWFFKAHFFQDPVWPGSLGLEAMLQLMQVFAVDRWKDDVRGFEFTETEHEWVYRGQVIPSDSEVTVQAIVTSIDDTTRTIRGRGYLSVDGRLIYSMKNFEIRVSCF